MKSIVVIDCASSSQMYIPDIVDMGYRPVVISTYTDLGHMAPEVAANFERVRRETGAFADTIVLDADDDVDSVLEKLKPYEVLCVVPGTDKGVRLADQLNSRLGLKGNDPETTCLRISKDGMVRALERAGVRAIKTRLVKGEEDVRDFWNTNGFTRAVLKFTESSGTVGVKICDSLDACLGYYRTMGSMSTAFGVTDCPVLMQEFIGGTEYIVNSLSIDGVHKVTDIWRYEKIFQPDGVIVYDYAVLVDRLTPGMQELISYDYAVLDAVEMRNGFCHTEIKIDDKGPVLIETNPRIMGANLTREYLDEIFGTHMTDITLKALLEPTFFPNFLRTPYKPHKSAIFKLAIVPRDVDADLGPFFEMVRHLDSYRETVYQRAPGYQRYVRTVDMETSPFILKLTNADYGELRRDYELIRQMEERYFDMVFTAGDHVDAVAPRTDLQRITSELPLSRRFAVVTDDGVKVHQFGRSEASEGWEVYDGVLFAMCGETTLTDRLRQIMKAMSQIRKGGLFMIVPESYEAVPHGTVSAEALMSIMGFNAEIPPSYGNGVLYGMKR